MSYVYFVQRDDDGPIKVGFANDPDARLSELQVGCPDELNLVGFIHGTARDEKRLHAMLAPGRIRGEWFRADTPGMRTILKYALPCEARQTPNGRDRMWRVFERATAPDFSSRVKNENACKGGE